jgi:hypothetical protein
MLFVHHGLAGGSDLLFASGHCRGKEQKHGNFHNANSVTVIQNARITSPHISMTAATPRAMAA